MFLHFHSVHGVITTVSSFTIIKTSSIMKSLMISLAQMDFSKISLCFTVLLHKAQKHTLGVLFCLYGGNVTLLLIMRVYQQI